MIHVMPLFKVRNTTINKMKNKTQNYHTVGTIKKIEKNKYHTVGRIKKIEKTKIPHCRKNKKTRKDKNTTLSEQLKN